MDLNDWILALHVLSAFAVVAALVLFWIIIVASQNLDTPAATLALSPVARVGVVAVSAGTIGTLVFGLWLAISLDAYHPWDGWVIAAIVLWALTGATGNRTGTEYNAARDRALELSEAGSIGPSADLLQMNRTRRGIVFHALTSLFVLLLLIDMIWKPGA